MGGRELLMMASLSSVPYSNLLCYSENNDKRFFLNGVDTFEFYRKFFRKILSQVFWVTGGSRIEP